MAYAAVISLKHTIHRLKNAINFPQITKPAYEELQSLDSMLKKMDDRSSRSIDRSVISELDAEIREAVWKLEDVLESYRSLDEEGVKQEIHSFLKTVKMLKRRYYKVLKSPLFGEDEDVATAVSTIDVGLSDLSENIMNQLLDETPELKTLSLVGMAGIGKTHLATKIYHNPLIVRWFDCILWSRVGPRDQINKMFVDFAAQIEHKPRDLCKEQNIVTLKVLLRKSLRGRRYLIVLDDIWTTQVFDYFTTLLPDDRNGSRLLLTTRQQEVAKYRKTKMHQLPFLNDEESWNLLWQNVFVEQPSFPSHLEKAGRKIAEKCEGLPLLILTVANILRGLDKTEEFWKKVAEKKTSTFTDAYDQIYKVLLPSYEYLSQHLKACFLYMGVFPQSCEIPLSKLINLWDVEDFLEPSIYQELDDFAMVCMKGLVSESLAIVCKWSSKRFRIKSAKLHSAYWHLCVKVARKSKFFHVLSKLIDVSKDEIESHRRLSIQNNVLFGIKEAYDSMAAATSSTTRSLLCTGEDHQYPIRICFNMMLLKVLDALAIRFYEFPEEVLNLLELRYLSLTHYGELPCSINKLQQLQWLILRRHHNIKLLRASTYLPQEIWDMQELRHLQIMGSNLADPSKATKLPKLVTLYVNADSCTEDVFRSIPNLKKLGIHIELEPEANAETLRCLEHIGVLEALESLKCVVVNHLNSIVAPPEHLSNLPRSVKKLSLTGLGYSWKCMTAIGSLPDLEVLKLRCSAFQGLEWDAHDRQFNSLKFLLLEDIDLVHWTIGGYCFRRLTHLIVRHCYKLKMIPMQIGCIRYSFLSRSDSNLNLEKLEVYI